ncbi:MAG: Gfo/Idh/MocA family protein, partial [Actinomycetota bacterium]
VVVGAGAHIFNWHRPGLESDGFELVGVCDVEPERSRDRAREMGCSSYTNHEEMLDEARPDVAVVMTPHPSHAPISIRCLQAGCHVLVEKPMALHAGEADAMIDAAARNERLLAVCFQNRLRADVAGAKKLVSGGRIGAIQRVEVTRTWPRTAAYYADVPWRGTWAGEGGGVLMNQAPHHLDLLCHLLGRPARVAGWTRRLLHDIETEDTVHAILEWDEGALGFFHASTAQAGTPERFEIVGTKGRLLIIPEDLRLYTYEADVRDHVSSDADPYMEPPAEHEAVELEFVPFGHEAVYENLWRAIIEGEPLLADGSEGRMSLEVANALTYAGHSHCQVELPLDRARYESLLAELGSSGGGTV